MTIKETIKKGFVGSFSLPIISNISRRLAADNAIVFMLHRFQQPDLNLPGHDPKFLRQCLEELRQQQYNLVTVDDILEAHDKGEPIPNAVAFTIDDGYFDHAEVGGAIFAEYDCPATFFVISDFIDGTYWPEDAKVEYLFENTSITHITWQFQSLSLNTSLTSDPLRQAAAEKVIWGAKSLPIKQAQAATKSLASILEVEIPNTAPNKYKPMSWEQARQLEQKGMRIGAHTRQHVILNQEDYDTASKEITGSYKAIKENTANPSKIFCYPTGRAQDFSPRDVNIIQESGFNGAVSTTPGYLTQQKIALKYSIPRFGLPENLTDFRQITLYPEWLKMKFRHS